MVQSNGVSWSLWQGQTCRLPMQAPVRTGVELLALTSPRFFSLPAPKPGCDLPHWCLLVSLICMNADILHASSVAGVSCQTMPAVAFNMRQLAQKALCIIQSQ